MKNNYATEIVNNLEARGESPSYIVGYLQSTINAMHYMTDSKILTEYLERAVQETKNA
jgi:hypothetical protein